MSAPSITFTDGTGLVTITLSVPAFEAWTPMVRSVGDRETALGTGATVEYRYRADYGAAFRVPYLVASQLALAARLKLWLLSGGAVTVTTADVAARVYTCTLWPGADVQDPELTDRTLFWYALSLQLKNAAAAPMLCVYAPGS